MKTLAMVLLVILLHGPQTELPGPTREPGSPCDQQQKELCQR